MMGIESPHQAVIPQARHAAEDVRILQEMRIQGVVEQLDRGFDGHVGAMTKMLGRLMSGPTMTGIRERGKSMMHRDSRTWRFMSRWEEHIKGMVMPSTLFEELGLNKREAKEVVELFFEEVRASLEGNEQVKLSGFGNFDLRDKKERPGRNPKTGEEIPITARRVVTFRPGQKLKARVEAYAGTGE